MNTCILRLLSSTSYSTTEIYIETNINRLQNNSSGDSSASLNYHPAFFRPVSGIHSHQIQCMSGGRATVSTGGLVAIILLNSFCPRIVFICGTKKRFGKMAQKIMFPFPGIEKQLKYDCAEPPITSGLKHCHDYRTMNSQNTWC